MEGSAGPSLRSNHFLITLSSLRSQVWKFDELKTKLFISLLETVAFTKYKGLYTQHKDSRHLKGSLWVRGLGHNPPTTISCMVQSDFNHIFSSLNMMESIMICVWTHLKVCASYSLRRSMCSDTATHTLVYTQTHKNTHVYTEIHTPKVFFSKWLTDPETTGRGCVHGDPDHTFKLAASTWMMCVWQPQHLAPQTLIGNLLPSQPTSNFHLNPNFVFSQKHSWLCSSPAARFSILSFTAERSPSLCDDILQSPVHTS